MPTRDEQLAKANAPAQRAMQLHPYYHGKIQTTAKVPVKSLQDFSVWYTPGVAEPCKAIAADPCLVYEHTNKGNTVAIVSDGTRVLGLGDIGPRAAMPVMEGKALLFKYLGGVDAVPLCIDAETPEEMISFVRAIQPTFGGVNLEDIAQPKCFRILDTLRNDPNMRIPVFHDDQQGTATVLLSGLLNALEIVGKELRDIRIALVGTGAANIAVLRLLMASGVSMAQITATDVRGILHENRKDLRDESEDCPDRWQLCLQGNPDNRRGAIAEAMEDADVVIAFACPGPGVIKPEWVHTMADDAIVFACSNPTPEIWPWEAKEAGARIVGTGRSDFANQLNNSLGFPAIFRGALDVRAKTITDEMCLAAAHELATTGQERGLSEDTILPKMDDFEIYPREALAVGLCAIEQGVAQIEMSRDELEKTVRSRINTGREMIESMMEHGLIAPAPGQDE